MARRGRKQRRAVQYVRDSGRENAKEERRNCKGRGKEKDRLLRVLDGNFSNEKNMPLLRFGLHQYELQQVLLLTLKFLCCC